MNPVYCKERLSCKERRHLCCLDCEGYTACHKLERCENDPEKCGCSSETPVIKAGHINKRYL